MSHNQSRVEKSDGQLRKSGGRPGQGRGFSGRGGKSGGGGSAAASLQQLSSSNQPSLSTNRSFKKPGNGQGGQSRVTPASLGGDATTSSATTKAPQNGAHGQALLQGSTAAPALGGPRPGDAPQTFPKAPPQSAPGTSYSVASSTPVKGDVSKPFALQFGSISPGLVGLQIPARTSSAPPNLDEQKQAQARHDSFRAVPTLPIPPGPKQQPQAARKDVAGVTQSTSGESVPPVQVKRDVHQQISTAPAVPQQKSAALHLPGISMPMSFQQPPIPMQFGGPGSQQMPMTLPIGNAPQVPQQMFVHNLPSHPLQPQPMIHQGQGLGFGHQINHQLGNLGIGIPNPQFSQQQQPGKYGGPRKNTVKITHPETHEEVRLGKRADLYNDGSSSRQRSPNNAVQQPQAIPSFTPSHYYPPLQPNSYNAAPIFFPTSNPVTTSAQHPRFSYPMGQNTPGISFMNPSLVNPMPGSKPVHSLYGPSEPGKQEPPPVTVSLAPVEGLVKSTVSLHNPKIGVPVVTSKAEEPKLISTHGETSGHRQRDNEVSEESSVQQSEMLSQPPRITLLPASSGESAVVSSVASSQIPQSGTTSCSAIASGNSGPVQVGKDDQKSEPIRRSDSLKDQHKKLSKKDPRLSQQTDEAIPGVTTKVASLKISKDGDPEGVESGQLPDHVENVQESLMADASTTVTSLLAPHTEHTVSSEVGYGDAVECKTIPAELSSSALIANAVAPYGVTTRNLDSVDLASSVRTSIKGKRPSDLSSSSVLDVVEHISKDLESSVCQEMSADLEDGKVSEVSRLDNSKSRVHSESSITEFSEDVKPSIMVRQEEEDAKELIDNDTRGLERELLSSDVERTSAVIVGQGSAPSDLIKVTSDGKYLPSSQDTNELDANCGHDLGSTAPNVPQEEAVAIGVTERIDEAGALVAEVHKDDPAPLVTAGPRDNSFLESTKAKPVTGKKKKRREILSKADAAGASDLYNAYKGPEEKNEAANISESVDSSLTDDRNHLNAVNYDRDEVVVEEDVEGRTEVDDWEDAVDASTPKLENGKQVNEANTHPEDDGSEASGRKYTRDFLLTFSEHCTDLPRGFDIGSDISASLMCATLSRSHGVERDLYPSPGRITDRSPGASRGDRRVTGVVDEEKWIRTPGPPHDVRADVGQNFRPGQGVNYGVSRNMRGQPSNQFAPILSGPMQSFVQQGGPVRINSDADRWRSNNSRGLMPPPQAPQQVMHKAEKKYEIGKVSDEEQGKQRQLKGILNKLTPQNFDKLFQQVKDVNIDNTITLTGVISQIFDKALMEPTFCEMYANFCFHLSSELPDFKENDEKITFKRLLLNKCQEEFERGEREQAEANRVEEEGEIKQSEEEREEKRVKARRRMLGNIRLIGELYKKKMLTERIMHECIKKLLGQYQNPDEEDLESLCKLMSTIGEQIDHAKAKVHMDSYFESMLRLSTNQKLSSRVRFMLRDVIDLRKNRWLQRRKVEGPKKIDEVHRDAAQERQSQASRLSRGPSMNSASRRGLPVDYGSRGSSVLPSPASQMGGIRGLSPPVRGFGMQDVRSEDRHPLDNRMLSVQRPIDDSCITLGPQGGLAKGMSIRGQSSMSSISVADIPLRNVDERRMASGSNGYSSTLDRVHYNPREDMQLRHIPGRSTDRVFDKIPATMSVEQAQGSVDGSASTTSYAKPLSEEVLREKSISAIREFYSAKDEKELTLCVKELNVPGFYPTMVSIWVTDSFERKDMERDLLASLLVNLCKSHDSVLSQVQLTQGFESVLSSLEDAVNDAPRAAEFLSRIIVKVILENIVSLSEIGKLIHEGGEEPGRLLEIGLASEVLGSILEIIKSEKGDSVLNEILTSSKLQLERFRPPHPIKPKKLGAFL